MDVSHTGEDAIGRILAGAYQACLIDVMLPGIDGFETVRRFRQAGASVPTLILTARFKTEDRIEGLDAGADDYLPKPFALGELLARVRALLRRGTPSTSPVLAIDNLTLDPAAKRVHRNGRRIDLSATEYGLLEYFMRNQGRIVTKAQILDHVWGDQGFLSDNNVEVYVNYLRKKTESFDAARLIHTVRGLGYVMERRPSD